MAFIDILGLGATALFGVGVGARAFGPIIAPAVGKVLGTGASMASFAARKAILPGAWGITKGLPSLASSAARVAFGAGSFAVRHPYMTAGAIGTGAYLATHQSPYESPTTEGKLDNIRLSTSFKQEQIAAEALNERGISPMGGIVSGAAIRNQRLMESTMGLTQGMWRSRH